MDVVILAGYRKDFPVMRKPQAFLPLLNKPLIEYLLNKLKDHNIIIVTPYPEEFKGFGFEVIKDDERGSASAIKAVEKRVDGPFVVHFSDVFMPTRIDQIYEMHMQRAALMTLGIVHTEKPWLYGVVATDPSNKVVRYLVKPRPDLVFSSKVFAGVAVLDPVIFDKIPYEMRIDELISYFVQRNDAIYAYELRGIWYRIRSVWEYVHATSDYLNRKMELTQENVKGVNIFPPVSLINVKGSLSFIGPGVAAKDVVLGKNVKIRNSVILEGAKIGDNVTITDSVIGPNAEIMDNSIITESLIGEDTRVYENSKVGKSTIGIDKDVMENVFEITLI